MTWFSGKLQTTYEMWKKSMRTFTSFYLWLFLPAGISGFIFHTPRKNPLLLQSQLSVKDATREGIDIDLLSKLNNCKSGTEARTILEGALGGSQPLYNSVRILPSASEKGISDADLAIQTKVRNTRYSVLELIDLNGDTDADRASFALLSLAIASTSSALVANQNLPGPEIVRFVAVWVLSFAPFVFLGYGIATPEELQKVLITIQREIFPIYRKRVIQHEAGHFLMGYLLGLPIQSYSTNAIKNAVEFYPLNDPNTGKVKAKQLGFDSINRQDETSTTYDSQMELSTSAYYSKEGRGRSQIEQQSVFRRDKRYFENAFLKIPAANDPSKSWPFRGFDDTIIDKLTSISVAGACAEILAFGNAEGGFADFSQLRQLFNSAEANLSERDMENKVRYAIGFVTTQLRLHLGALDAVAEAMEKGASIAECVLAIENCSNISGNDGISEDYDVRRRKSFRLDRIGPIEKIFLGGKNADVEETRVISGIGGGDKKKSFAITGDDPLYAAIAVAVSFLIWAVNGGLSLH
jgi:hypothetical protein